MPALLKFSQEQCVDFDNIKRENVDRGLNIPIDHPSFRKKLHQEPFSESLRKEGHTIEYIEI